MTSKLTVRKITIEQSTESNRKLSVQITRWAEVVPETDKRKAKKCTIRLDGYRVRIYHNITPASLQRVIECLNA